MIGFVVLFAFAIFTSGTCGVPNLEQVTLPVDHGEGPTWDARTGILYFVDLHNGRVLAYDPIKHNLTTADIGGDLTPVIPCLADISKFAIGVNRSIAILDWDHETNDQNAKIEVIATVATDRPTSRFNDGKADSEGRLWFGTMGYEDINGVLAPNEGALFFVTNENIKNPEEVIKPVNISNGLAWNYADNKFYYIDTPTRKVKQYDYDSDTGKISNEKVAFDLGKYALKGYPDGMTIDADDNLWIALYNGGAVIKVSPKTRELLQVIKLPVSHVTSVAWGGANLDTLFVTTSRYTLNAEERAKEPKAGSLFALTNLDAYGLPANEADVC